MAELLQQDAPHGTAAAEAPASTDSVKKNPFVPSEEPPWPAATVEEKEFHFGRMRMGEKDGEHEFVIANTGDAPLELKAGEATCQCTTFELSKEIVPPGDSATLLFTWKLARVDPKFSHGGPVYTNDPKRTQIDFRVTGMVDESITIKPSGTWFAGNLGDEPVTFEADVFSRVMDELTIKSASMKTEYTTIDWAPLKPVALARNDALSGYRFQVTVSPDFPVGKLEDVLTLDLEELDRPLEIPVTANREGSIHMVGMKGARFDPNQKGLNLGRFKAAEGREAQIMVIVKQKGLEGDFKLVNVESEIPALQVSLEPTGEPTGTVRRYVMTVRLPPGSPRIQRPAGNSAKVHCETNHPTGEPIDLLIRIDSY